MVIYREVLFSDFLNHDMKVLHIESINASVLKDNMSIPTDFKRKRKSGEIKEFIGKFILKFPKYDEM